MSFDVLQVGVLNKVDFSLCFTAIFEEHIFRKILLTAYLIQTVLSLLLHMGYDRDYLNYSFNVTTVCYCNQMI